MFFSSKPLQIGQVRYARRPFFLSHQQKASVRKRLRAVDGVIATLKESNLHIEGLDQAVIKTESEMTPREKYYVFSSTQKGHAKPITQVPKFTKMPHPRGFPLGYQK